MLPLDGIRVIEFSGHASGPLCSQTLSDFGAEVIKLGPPASDKARKRVHARYGAKGDLSSIYQALSRNMDSIVVNLKHPDAWEIVKTPHASADVVPENFRRGSWNALASATRMSGINPRIVYCNISAFGSTGPLVACGAFRIRLLMQAYTGPLSITGEPDRLVPAFQYVSTLKDT